MNAAYAIKFFHYSYYISCYNTEGDYHEIQPLLEFPRLYFERSRNAFARRFKLDLMVKSFWN